MGMELGVALVLTGGLSFVGILGLAAFRQWARAASDSSNMAYRLQLDQTVRDLTARLQRAETAENNWKTRFHRRERTGDLDLQDEDWEYDPDDKEGSIGSLVQTIWPKMPPTLKAAMDRPELQTAILNTIQKNPDVVNTLVDRFLGPKTESSAPAAPNGPAPGGQAYH